MCWNMKGYKPDQSTLRARRISKPRSSGCIIFSGNIETKKCLSASETGFGPLRMRTLQRLPLIFDIPLSVVTRQNFALSAAFCCDKTRGLASAKLQRYRTNASESDVISWTTRSRSRLFEWSLKSVHLKIRNSLFKVIVEDGNTAPGLRCSWNLNAPNSVIFSEFILLDNNIQPATCFPTPDDWRHQFHSSSWWQVSETVTSPLPSTALYTIDTRNVRKFRMFLFINFIVS